MPHLGAAGERLSAFRRGLRLVAAAVTGGGGPTVLASAVSTAGGSGAGIYEMDTAFVPSATITINAIRVKFASAGTWRVGIASTFPHNAQDVVSVNGVNGSLADADGYTTIPLPGPVTLTAGVQYAIDVYDPTSGGFNFYTGTAMTQTGLALSFGGGNLNGSTFWNGHWVDFELTS